MEIIVTPKKAPVTINEVTGKKIRLKVAAYARVSTDLDDQKNSFEFQKEEFEARIKSNPNWDFVGMYSDEGISGTSISKREGFKQMIDDAKSGKIDKILTKSISRFARNTVDFLNTIRELASINVSVYFEKENITTNNENIDLILTLYASLAESESRSISENVKWGIRKRMSKNEKKVPVGKTIGYDYQKDGSWTINQEAPLIEHIFEYFLEGYTYRQIGTKIESEDKKGRKWPPGKIHNILKNERYKGFIIHQKTVIIDFLTHKQVKNDGIEPMYTVVGHHPAIIDEKTFDYVQLLLKGNASFGAQQHSNYCEFYKLVFCEKCGRPMVRIKYQHNNQYILTCKNVNKSNPNYMPCDSGTIPYTFLQSLCKEVLQKFKQFDKQNCSFTNTLIEELSSFDFVKQENQIKDKIAHIDKEINELVAKQVKTENNDTYESDFCALKAKRNLLSEKLERVCNLAKENFILHKNLKQITLFLQNDYEKELVELKEIFYKIIHRVDGSLRFIVKGPGFETLSDKEKDIAINENPPLFMNIFSSEGITTKYDVIVLKGVKND